jgi:hypothetical protein
MCKQIVNIKVSRKGDHTKNGWFDCMIIMHTRIENLDTRIMTTRWPIKEHHSLTNSCCTDCLSNLKCCASFWSNRWLTSLTEMARQSHLSTTSCSLLTFMSVTCSSRVILFATSKGSSTTFGLIYRSSNKIWGDNQGKDHEKITHQCCFIMDHD